MRLGNYSSAEPLFLQVLESQINIGSSSASSTLNSLALVMVKQGRMAEAEEYFSRVAATKEEVGYDTQVRSAYNNMGYINILQQKYDDAEAYLQKSADIEQRNPEMIVLVKAEDSINMVETFFKKQ
jgi:Flp pilus assembly protein TadD